MFYKKGILKNFLKPATLLKEAPRLVLVFLCELWTIFKNIFFHRTPPVAASEDTALGSFILALKVEGSDENYNNNIEIHLFFYKQPVHKQLALGWPIAKQFSGPNSLSLSNNINYK